MTDDVEADDLDPAMIRWRLSAFCDAWKIPERHRGPLLDVPDADLLDIHRPGGLLDFNRVVARISLDWVLLGEGKPLRPYWPASAAPSGIR